MADIVRVNAVPEWLQVGRCSGSLNFEFVTELLDLEWFENDQTVFMLIMSVIGAVVDAGGYTTAFVVLDALLLLGGLAPFLLREPRTPLDPQGPCAAGPDADATTPPGEPHAGTTGRPDSRR